MTKQDIADIVKDLDIKKDQIEEASQEIEDSDDGETFESDGITYRYFENEDEAERVALERVKEDLESDPEMFTQDWLQSFITITPTDKRLIAIDMADSLLDGMSDKDIIAQAEERDNTRNWQDEYDNLEDKITNEEDEKEVKKYEEQLEKLVEDAREFVQSDEADKVEEALDDPIEYFVREHGLYTEEELLKQNFIVIDYNEAAEDAIRQDGWAHFLSTWDGNYESTSTGLVWFRD